MYAMLLTLIRLVRVHVSALMQFQISTQDYFDLMTLAICVAVLIYFEHITEY